MSRFASSGMEDAAALKAKQVADMISKTLIGVQQPAAAPLNSKNIMMIPSNKVGMVIGKGGSQIRDIENTTGVRLQLDATGEPNRKLWIQGSDESVARARAKIESILSITFGGRANQNPTKIVSIPSEKVGLLIGAGGTTIKRFSQEHSCHLKVVSEEEAVRTRQQVPEKGFQHLHIIGTAEAAANAEKAVLEFLNSPSMGAGRGGYGAYQQQVYQQRVQPYAAYSPQNYGALIQAYTNVGQPYMNTYPYAQPGQMYPPQGYNAQAIAGFQQPTAFVAPPAQSPDGMKSPEVNYAAAQNLPQNVAMYQPQQAGNQMMNNQLMNNQSSPTFGGQIQTQTAGTRPSNTELPSGQNLFNQASKGNSQPVGNPPGVGNIQQINQPPTTLYNYPVPNYPGIPQSQVAPVRQPSPNQTAYDPANTGHNLQVQYPVGGPNFISPGNSQQVPATNIKPSGNLQTSASNIAGNPQVMAGTV